TVQLNTVQKNNEALDAITITSPDSNVSPTIYLNSFYEDYQNGQDMDTIMDRIADVRVEHEVSQDFDVSKITDFDQVKDHIAARVVGMEDNADLLDQRPHAEMDDLAVTYCVMLGEDANGSMSVPVTNQLMETWGVTQEDLHDLAKANQDELTPSTFKSMNEVMAEMMIPQIMDDMGLDREAAQEMVESMMPPEDKMFVLSNEQKLNGAAALLDDKMMDQIAEKVGGDFYILPSSVHEVLIVPADAGMDLKDLEAMVQEVNETQVAPQDRLSDHVYQYDTDTHEVFRADRAEEHQQAKEEAKESVEMPKDAVAEQPKDKAEKAAPEKGEKKAEKGDKEKTSLKERLDDKKKEAKAQEKKSPEKAMEKSKKKDQSL
ncbi:MAG: DUF5688 family protein, partial [Lachnospiraceae bacterium]|nr:DUF5688 family protein [Lachnospiraceae bacterium]